MRVAFDTNILGYAEGVNGSQNRAAALALLRRAPAESVLPAQTLGELFNILTRKAGWNASAARDAVLGWRDAFEVAETSAEVVLDALELAVDRRLGVWDAIILVSEDLQDGFTWRGVTVTNPFAGEPNPLLASLLASGPDPK